jgi:hypothetical protein
MKISKSVLKEIIRAAAHGGTVGKKTAKILYHNLDAMPSKNQGGLELHCCGVRFFHPTPRRHSVVKKKIPNRAPVPNKVSPAWQRKRT